jgi:16S rRNA (guanine966-N2)-methyltransferase
VPTWHDAAVRVVAGSAKGVRLVGPRGYEGTRPISDRAKEALMSILGARLAGAEVLDLFAGVGNVGIEALSRGAAHATFVELGAAPLRDIRENVGRARVAERATVVQQDVFAFLAREPRPADVLFYGPPQWQGLWERTTLALDARPGWLAPDGIAVLQCDPSEYRPLALAALREQDRRRYGNVQLTFFERA